VPPTRGNPEGRSRLRRKNKRRTTKGENAEMQKYKQTQAVILTQKVKRKSHRRRKIIPFDDWVDESLRCEERTQRKLQRRGAVEKMQRE